MLKWLLQIVSDKQFKMVILIADGVGVVEGWKSDRTVISQHTVFINEINV